MRCRRRVINVSAVKRKVDDMRILLIEDNERLQGFVRTCMEKAGFAVDAIANGADADAALREVRYDAIVLDLGLPDIDGTALLSELRRRKDSTPVLVLTARDSVEDRVAALDLGADDYLLKPFAMDELLARLRAILRRPGQALSLTLDCGNVSFDTTNRLVTIAGNALALGSRECSALELLLRRVGRVVPKTMFEQAIYAFDNEVGVNAIEVLVHRLRKRLEGAGADLQIHTVRGVGYMAVDHPG